MRCIRIGWMAGGECKHLAYLWVPPASEDCAVAITLAFTNIKVLRKIYRDVYC
jgi:hypothetical protein